MLRIFTLLALLSAPLAAAAQEPDDDSATGPDTDTSAPVYIPPERGAPGRRMSGGTRGLTGTSLALYVLAPEHTGYTLQEQPGLYWYAAFNGSQASMEFTLMEAESDEVLLVEKTPIMDTSGVYRIDLDEYDVHLRPHVEYRWVVRLQEEDQDSSPASVVASAGILRVDPPAELAGAADGSGTVALYAAHGIWYDAIDRLSTRIRSQPLNAPLRLQRATLLDQIDLDTVARYDRAHAVNP